MFSNLFVALIFKSGIHPVTGRHKAAVRIGIIRHKPVAETYKSPLSLARFSMLLSYVASASFEKKQPGTPSLWSRWCATHAQHFP